jgi:WbqC-like protein
VTPQSQGATVVILQPGYLPWLGFFDQLRRADVFVYYDDVQYDKHGWRNRNRIKTQSGPLWLTVPVKHGGEGLPRIRDVEIDARTPWARKHVASLRQAYARAPFLGSYLPALEELLERPWERLVDLDIACADLMAEWFGLHPTTAQQTRGRDPGRRPRIERSSGLGIGGERSERLVKICRHFGASTYVSGDAAAGYLDVGLFERNGIAVEWQRYIHPTYPQLHGVFVPHLSALDLLFNCGEEAPLIAFAAIR